MRLLKSFYMTFRSRSCTSCDVHDRPLFIDCLNYPFWPYIKHKSIIARCTYDVGLNMYNHRHVKQWVMRKCYMTFQADHVRHVTYMIGYTLSPPLRPLYIFWELFFSNKLPKDTLQPVGMVGRVKHRSAGGKRWILYSADHVRLPIMYVRRSCTSLF